jgi:hypothetical protein
MPEMGDRSFACLQPRFDLLEIPAVWQSNPGVLDNASCPIDQQQTLGEWRITHFDVLATDQTGKGNAEVAYSAKDATAFAFVGNGRWRGQPPGVMGLGDVDKKKLNPVLVGLMEFVEARQLTTENVAAETSEHQENRFLASKIGQANQVLV